MRLVRMTTMTRRWMSPSTLHIHHHDSNTAMTSRQAKSFPVLHVDQIAKVWEVTLINSILTVMMILLLKLSLLFLPFMVCMMLKLI
jgi:hypothetical protein